MRRTLTGLLLLFVALATLAAAQLVRKPDSALAPLYDRYRHREGLRTALIADYRVDDSTAVDLLMLTATDSAAWQWMMQEFNLMPLPQYVIDLMEKNKISPVSFRLAAMERPEEPMELESGHIEMEFEMGNVDKIAVVVTERTMHSISIIEIDSFDKIKAVVKHNAEEIIFNYKKDLL